MIVVAGEALIDLIPDGEVLRPLPGGSPYNVAVGLGRLGARAAFLGRLSRDGFGRRLAGRLSAEGIDLGLVTRTHEPTTLAVLHLDSDGRAGYGFYLAGTSAAGLRPADLPELPDGAALHVSLGAVTLETDPAGTALWGLLERERGRRLVSLDPNVRPAVLDDTVVYGRVVEEAVAACDLVKVSEEDLALLYPGSPLQAARRWLAEGPALVVITRGAEGAVALTAAGDVEVPGEPAQVVDTVGAGDAFTAGLLAWLGDLHQLHRGALDRLTTEDVMAALRHAVRVAARTCEREGADPPTAAEI
jgi:fructokinase